MPHHSSREGRRAVERRMRKAARAARIVVLTMVEDGEGVFDDCDCSVCRAIAAGGDGVEEMLDLLVRAEAGDPGVVVVYDLDGEDVLVGGRREDRH